MCMSTNKDGSFKCSNFEQVLQNLHKFLESHDLFKKEFVTMSCGEFDGKQLRREADFKNLKLSNYLKRWINIKKVFPGQIPHNLSNDSFKNHHLNFMKMNQMKKQKDVAKGMTD